MERVLLLNADYTYLCTLRWQRAVCLMIQNKVEVLKHGDRQVANVGRTVVITLPLILRLLRMVRSIYKNRVPFRPKNVIIRDNWTCQYCGSTDRNNLTIDHMIPKSRNGRHNFENCVAACKDCNNKKGDRTPREANMFTKRQPYQPTISEFLMQRMKDYGIRELLEEIWCECSK